MDTHAPGSPIEIFAPGRVELLGNHTDYNEGFVLSFAVEQGITARGAANGSALATIETRDLGRSIRVPVAGAAPSADEPWANYILGVVDGFARRGVAVPGFDLSVSSSLPMGAGMSSSAALECSTALFLQQLCRTGFSLKELAVIAQEAEHRFAGVKCGLLDQITSLHGRDGHIVFTDFRSLEVQTLPCPPDAIFVLYLSGVHHALVAGEYNSRREACHGAAAALGAKALRDISSATLDKQASLLTHEQSQRAWHVVGENSRVQEALGALRSSDITLLGDLMFRSHDSSRAYFENSCPELDALVEWAKCAPGCCGARLTGGGFGGATINLVRQPDLARFLDFMNLRYRNFFDKEAAPIITRCAGSKIPPP